MFNEPQGRLYALLSSHGIGRGERWGYSLSKLAPFALETAMWTICHSRGNLPIKDLVDNYQPDLLYTDGGLPFEEYGLSLVAHLCNANAKRHGGKVEAVYNSKRKEDCAEGTCVLDFERGLADAIQPNPWQTDTCVGNWHYKRDVKYKTTKRVVDMLVDIVSRNGNVLLNFPLPAAAPLHLGEFQMPVGLLISPRKMC